jgi:hypothetical protein
MKAFQLFIDCENDVFLPESGLELARILRDIASYVENNGTPSLWQTVNDSNGNDVGRYALVQTRKRY